MKIFADKSKVERPYHLQLDVLIECREIYRKIVLTPLTPALY